MTERDAEKDLEFSWGRGMSDYRQHSPKRITKNNIPGKCLRAFLWADINFTEPTYGDLQAISRERGYEFNNASAAVSQLREILQEADMGTVVCIGAKPGKLNVIIWSPVHFFACLREMAISIDPCDLSRTCIKIDPAARIEYKAKGA